MTKLLAMPSSDNIESLKPYADGFLFGICDWSVNTPFNISLEKLKKIKDNCENKEIFVSLNKNIYSYELQALEKILLQLEKININGIFYADTCLIQLKKKLHLKTPLIWAQEHLTTNYETINFWKKYGVSGTYLSPEITLEEIKEIRNHTKVKLFVPIFGYMPMFTSKRHIIKNYLDHFKLDSNSNIYYMKKEGYSYPIVDNTEGTVAYTPTVVSGFEEYLNLDVDYVTLNSFDIDPEKFIKILKIYKEKNLEEAKTINQLISNLDKGFLYKETIYKVKR